MRNIMLTIMCLGMIAMVFTGLTGSAFAGDYNSYSDLNQSGDILIFITTIIFPFYDADFSQFGDWIHIVIIILLIPSFVCSVAASNKGLNPVLFFIFSALFTPIIGFLAVIAFKE